MKKMNINDAARELGVSASTVSRSLSGKGRISKETRRRVIEYAREHGWNPELIGRAERGGRKTETVAVILPEVDELVEQPFFYACMSGVNEMALANGYDMLVIIAGREDLTHLKRVVETGKADGVILMRTYRDDPSAAWLKAAGVPFVSVGSLDDDSAVQVDYDNAGACRDLTAVLLARGMRRIAYLGSDDGKIVNEERYAGYLQAYEEAGLKAGKEYVCRERLTPSGTRKMVERFLEMEADCILCQDDAVCLEVLKELRARGVKIPEEIRVASCYNSRFLENYPVTVTTLDFDAMESGREASRLLLEMLRGQEVPVKTVLSHEVLLKESTEIRG